MNQKNYQPRYRGSAAGTQSEASTVELVRNAQSGCRLVQVVSIAHLVLMRPQCYLKLVALKPRGPEYIQESCVFRIEQAVTRGRQRIRRCTLIRAARFGDINQPTFFFISHGFSVVCHWIDGIPES